MIPSLLHAKMMPAGRVPKRLLPIYVACFFEGLIFWYAIEKVFMVHIGFSTRLITLNVIITFAVGVLCNIPTGILADRWSRKGVIIGASCCLAIASLLLGLATSPLQYILASILFGLYYAGYEGTYSAMIYDVMIDENKSREGFEKYYGYTSFIESIALIIASLFGGLIGSKIGLSAAYFFSIPGCVISIFALSRFKEPLLHKSQTVAKNNLSFRELLNYIVRTRTALWICLTLVFCMVLYEFILELDQLWPLALHLRLILYGPLNALLLLGYGLSGVLAGFIAKKFGYITATAIIGLICTCLLMIHSMPVIAVAEFGILVCFIGLYTVALGKLHDHLPANIRSSVSSVVSMFGGVIFIPYALLFGFIAQAQSVFMAARILIPLALVSAIGSVFVANHTIRKTDVR